ncbi:MAG: hypothetical protein RL693_1575 [Verrucomicrobiota bacterium]|jgi:hypothetical protein
MTNTSDKKKPVCGLLSIVMPPIGLLFVFSMLALIQKPVGPEQLSGAGIAIPILALSSSVSGIGFGVMGMVRCERYRYLSEFGVVWSLGWVASYFIM